MLDVGRYRIVRRIGRGGMAEVFEAVALGNDGFERRVALKRLLPDVAAEFGPSFVDEARIASQLHHGSIVGIFDYGEADGLAFQVLELVDGADAASLLQLAGGPLPLPVALHICTEIAHALEYAHTALDARGYSLGIVHRDIKPSNLLVGWTGDVKLGDFGVALATEREYQTRGGVVRGTPLYMAPEQAIRAAVDGRADGFALGCVLHALITGTSPIESSDRLVSLIAGVELEPALGIPEDVRAIITRATRKDREARYQTADELAEALGAALAPRLDRDARGMLRSWLAPLQPAVAETRGRFDDLVGVELVLTEDLDMRRFTTRS